MDVPDVNGENVFHAVAKLPPEISSVLAAVGIYLFLVGSVAKCRSHPCCGWVGGSNDRFQNPSCWYSLLYSNNCKIFYQFGFWAAGQLT